MGDKLMGYDDKTFESASVPVVKDLLLDNAKVLHVDRDGQKIDINISPLELLRYHRWRRQSELFEASFPE